MMETQESMAEAITARFSSECAVWYRMRDDGEINPEVFANEGHAAWEAARWDHGRGLDPDPPRQSAIGVQFPDGRAVLKEDWPAYAETVRFLGAKYTRPGYAAFPGGPFPEVQFSCPFTGERLRWYGAPPWLGVSQVRQDPGAFAAYLQEKQAAGEWPKTDPTADQMREALSKMPAGDDARAWLESALSRR